LGYLRATLISQQLPVEFEVLEAVGLTKRYSGIPAVQDVSFQIRRGQILGYLGPNGSGKSTTVKMLTGLIEPSDGRILFDGARVHEGNPSFSRNLGYVPEEPHLYSHLTGPEYLRLIGRLHSIPRKPLERKIDAFIDLFSLTACGGSTKKSALHKKVTGSSILLGVCLWGFGVRVLKQ
jgi:ABC-2 type transport system ATP-binding protein